MVEEEAGETAEALAEAIAGWDGKSRGDILAIHAEFAVEPDYLHWLSGFAQRGELSDGATWLLKHALEGGAAAPDLGAALAAAATSPHWPTQLHLLQLLPHLQLDDTLRPGAQRLVFAALSSKRAMVRAWAYAGADQLARQHPDLRLRVMQLLERARAEETAASVRARLDKCRL